MVSAVEAIALRHLREPITLADLSAACGLSRRDCESLIQQLRLRGEPIIDAGRDGLVLTDDPDRLAEYIERRLDRAKTILAAQKPLESTLARLQEREAVRHAATLWDEEFGVVDRESQPEFNGAFNRW